MKQVAGQLVCCVDAIKKLDFRQKQLQRSRCHFFTLRFYVTVYHYHCISAKKETVSLHVTRIVHLFLYAAVARESPRQR